MDTRPVRLGHLLAFGGAVATLGSLWAPWLQVSARDIARELVATGSQYGIPQQTTDYISQAAALVPHTFQADGWHVFHRSDIAIAALSALVMFLVLAATGVLNTAIAPKQAASNCAMPGLLIAALTGYQLIRSHGPDGIVHTAWGAWLCLAGAAAITLGGLWASIGQSVTADPAPLSPVYAGLRDPSTSVAPPGVR